MKQVFQRAAILALPLLALPAAPLAGAEPEEEATSPGSDEQGDPIVVDGELSRKQKKVCMSETATGSIMSRRVCYTVAQLEERKRIAEYVKDELGKKQARDRQVAEEMRSRQ